MKKVLSLLLALTMVFSLAACGNNDAPAEEPETPETENNEAAEPTTLRLAYMPNWGALWAAATAEAKGFFAEEGLTVEMTSFEDGPTEIAAMESGKIDISYIGPGAHKLCSTGNAQVVLLQHLGDGDCIIGLKGLKTLEELKGKTIGYAAGTSSETILNVALESVGLTMNDVNAMSMDATDICSNVDFASLVSPGSWVVNPNWAAENADAMTRFVRAMYKAMDYAAAATTDDAIAEEVAGYVADVIKSDAATVIEQRYTGSWMTSAQVLEAVNSGEALRIYGDQQATFIANGALEAEGNLTPEEFVLTDIMVEAGK